MSIEERFRLRLTVVVWPENCDLVSIWRQKVWRDHDLVSEVGYSPCCPPNRIVSPWWWTCIEDDLEEWRVDSIIELKFLAGKMLTNYNAGIKYGKIEFPPNHITSQTMAGNAIPYTYSNTPAIGRAPKEDAGPTEDELAGLDPKQRRLRLARAKAVSPSLPFFCHHKDIMADRCLERRSSDEPCRGGRWGCQK